jgi:hydroxyacylglutathione hydrolase
MENMIKIIGIPAFEDSYKNYIWVIHDCKEAWVVDPGESAPVLNYLKQQNLALKGILITHGHGDHVSGIEDILHKFSSINVIASQKCKHPTIKQYVSEGDTIMLFNGYTLDVLETPGHYHDHIILHNSEHLFCGDTLFPAGCGINFSNDYDVYSKSFAKIMGLSSAVKIYSGHEYTRDNLDFAHWIDQGNSILTNRFKNEHPQYPVIREQAQSTLELEKQTNPFLRFNISPLKELLVKKGADLQSDSSLLQTLREWKDFTDNNGIPSTKPIDNI